MNFPVLRNQLAQNLSHYNAPIRKTSKDPERQNANDNDETTDRKILLKAGLSIEKLDRIVSLAKRWDVSIREAALSLGAISAEKYVRSLEAFSGLKTDSSREAVELMQLSPPPEPYKLLKSLYPAPLRVPRTHVMLNTECCRTQNVADIISALGPQKYRLKLVSRAIMTAAIVRAYGAEIAVKAANGLWQRNPRFSAATGLIGWQIVALAIIAGLFLGAVIFAPRETLLIYSFAASFVFLIVILLRIAAAIYAFYRRFITRQKPYKQLSDKELPRYTVLVALYREARILPQLVASLKRLDYPPAKLDIKLILEEADAETIACVRAMQLPAYFEIFIVPDGMPRTKPRALNYALQFALGDFLVIYDAEDRPDPQQLRKAAAHFAAAPPEVVCLQGQLTFENYAQNWLAKQFTIEYASLFGGMLPLLDLARMPMPLGGTSNHFRVDILRKLGAWDAHNVTEDADLGIRIYRAGLRAEVLYSETIEEAACQPGNWLRQRTRWLKGWMQTYLVHMRQPRRLLRELGFSGFLAFQGHFAGIVLAALVYPVSFLIIANDVMAGWFLSQPQTLLGHHFLVIAIFNLLAGFTVSFTLGLFVMKRQHIRMLVPQIPSIPIYWLLISAAAYRALYQLMTAPHYWEKTEHFGAARQRQADNGSTSDCTYVSWRRKPGTQQNIRNSYAA